MKVEASGPQMKKRKTATSTVQGSIPHVSPIFLLNELNYLTSCISYKICLCDAM